MYTYKNIEEYTDSSSGCACWKYAAIFPISESVIPE